MRPQFSLLTFLLAITVLAIALWNYAPRTNQVILEKTGRPLDLAIVGEGYFELNADDGTVVYSRQGRFEVNRDFQIVHEKTAYVATSGISVPTDFNHLDVTPAGLVLAQVRGEYNKSAIGQINVSHFANEQKLARRGNTCFHNTVDSGQAISCIPGEHGAGYIAQGWLERETPRWTLEGNLPILMLFICVSAAALQVWMTINARSRGQISAPKLGHESNNEIA